MTTIGFSCGQVMRFYLIRIPALCCLLLIGWSHSFAQRPQYTIVATLDTLHHTISGKIDITYTNRSSVSLDSLGIHLWPNAYSSKSTALVKQMVQQHNFELYGADKNEMGGLSGLQFRADTLPVPFYIDKEHIDIGWLALLEPLSPGASIQISTPFKLAIPVSVSRLGRNGLSYQITQWYPHLAVFDEAGWHTMPYLDQGEFFNDFADYDVVISAPHPFTIAATGVLASKDVQEQMITWNFKANNVIDFAWFASPTFRHQQLSVFVGEDHPVELNIYIDSLQNELWDRAAFYATRALKFYSDWLGPYPYPQMSVVYAPLGAGGGMEYPMVAQIGYMSDSVALDLVIAHEIGHTWLYGILANDERTYAWLDEGLNSFIEKQYQASFHPTYKEIYLPKQCSTPASMDQVDAMQHALQFENSLEPPAAAPEKQKLFQYAYSAYVLPPQGLEIMMQMEGHDMMKRMFRQYYEEYKFTHVTPDDLRQSFESTCQCDLTWFFEDWIYHAHEVDYRVKKFDKQKKEVTIVNHGSAVIPLKLNTFKDGKPIMEHWLVGFENDKIIHLDDRADEVHLYDNLMGINKSWRSNIKPTSVVPRIGFLPKVESYTSPTIGITPVIGANLADGFLLGVGLTSGLFPQQHFKFVVAPMYGFGSKKLRGHATFRYIGDLDRGPFDKYMLSLAFDDFGYNLDTHYLFRDHYFRWEPSLAIRFHQDKTRSHSSQWIKYRFVHIDQFYGRGLNYEELLYAEEKRSYGIHELLYQYRSGIALKPFEAMANLQAGAGFLRLNLRYKQHFVGKDKRRGLWIQGYGGWLPVYDRKLANVDFTINGMASSGFFSRDYMYDQWLGGRNATDGLLAHQVYEKDANLKTLTTIGIGDEWMVGGGFSVALPFKWIHLYLDAALYPSALTEEIAFTYSGGFAIVMQKDAFEINMPFFESKDIRESLSYEVRDLWFERITFQANIKLYNPVNVIDRGQLGY